MSRRHPPVEVDPAALIALRNSGLSMRAIGERVGLSGKQVSFRLEKVGAKHIASDCSMCSHLAGQVRGKDVQIERLRQAYRELEDALAIADGRSASESVTQRDRAMSVALFERMERRRTADE